MFPYPTDPPIKTNYNSAYESKMFQQPINSYSEGNIIRRKHNLYQDVPYESSINMMEQEIQYPQNNNNWNHSNSSTYSYSANPSYAFDRVPSSEESYRSIASQNIEVAHDSESAHGNSRTPSSASYMHTGSQRSLNRPENSYYCRVCYCQVSKEDYVDHCLRCSDQQFFETKKQMESLSQDYNKMIEMRRQLPLTTEQLNQFAHISIQDSSQENFKDDDQLICSICREYFLQDSVVVILNCQHEYHKECIEKWFKDSQKATCPICQKNQNDYFFPKIPNFQSQENNVYFHSNMAKNHFINKFYKNQ